MPVRARRSHRAETVDPTGGELPKRAVSGLALGPARATPRAMSRTLPDLVSTDWLAERLAGNSTGAPDRGDIAVLDATRHLPDANRDPRAEFEAGHIPGASFLDLETLTDAASDVPQALPSPVQLQRRLSQLGVARGAAIVLYDDSRIRTSARAWFMLSAQGIDNVAILDGGLSKWRAEGRRIESGMPEIHAAQAPETTPPARVASKADMLANLASSREQVLDARGADRVFGMGIDPVHGGANGRIPGSLNLPYPEIFDDDGTYKSPADLRKAFVAAGIDLDRPVVTTCGSGVTASVLLFALHLIGKDDVRLYDGSWMEWSADPSTPKAQGPA